MTDKDLQSNQQSQRDIKAYLTTLSPGVLVEMLLKAALHDERLYQSLLVKSDRSANGDNLIETFREAIDKATFVEDYIEWRHVGAFAHKFEQVCDALAELLKPGSASMLAELAEYAIECAEEALEQVDDSAGEVGQSISSLGELHLKACLMAQDDPANLAERLLHLSMTLPFGICHFDVTTYRDALGQEGLMRYRELAQEQWSKVPPRDPKAGYDSGNSTITHIMEQLAEMRGDVDELVAIKARNLSSAHRYCLIAQIWAEAGQQDTALEWAERGLHAFPERPDNRLRDFLVAVYLSRQRNEEALQLTWIQFEENGSLENYIKLNDVCCKLGQWPAQRERALALAVLKASAPVRGKPDTAPPNNSVRIQIALWENDLDVAYELTQHGFCERNLLTSVAETLESTRPGNAVSLYRRVVPPIVEQTNNGAYEMAVKIIARVGVLMNVQNQSPLFEEYVLALRSQFKLKRNFIKLLDGMKQRGLNYQAK